MLKFALLRGLCSCQRPSPLPSSIDLPAALINRLPAQAVAQAEPQTIAP